MKNRIKDYWTRNFGSEPSDQLLETLIRLHLYKTEGLPGGSFVEAVADSDLHKAVAYADVESADNLRNIVVFYLNFQ